MLSSLQIQNFRALKDVKIKKLGRVNLIVGENNSGKSSVLEALRIYASRADEHILDEIATEHNEPRLYNDNNIMSYTLPYASFFYGRNYPIEYGEKIIMGEVGNNFLSLEHIVELVKTEETTLNDGEYQIKRTRQILPKVLLNKTRQRNGVEELIKVEYNNQTINRIVLNVDAIGFYRDELENMIYGYKEFKYIPTSFVELDDLARIWDGIALTNYEIFIIEALKIIEPDIEGLRFISINKHSLLDKVDRFPIVKLRNFDEPIPLNSMGDGMKRILQLILNLHQAKDGLLLIDEFDNGLHYKVQEKVWGLLFELAERFNVQVFATTHSNDCIRAFSKISQARTDIEGILIQMTKEQYKDGTSQITANTVDESQLQRLLNLGVDVR